MRIVKSCEDCLYRKQENIASNIKDAALRDEYLKTVRHILDTRDDNDSSPYIVSLFRELQTKYGVPLSIFPKSKYNRMMLDIEPELESMIDSSPDPLKTALLYSRVGNYIDFGAMNTVDDNLLIKLLDEAGESTLDADTYERFHNECINSHSLLLICDNCGEIVLDKLLIHQIKKKYPHLTVTVMVRGRDVLNDATMEDAIESGIVNEATVITNGSAIAGTVYEHLSEEARRAFDASDIIISKGQGNYESIAGSSHKVFYLFLCKCDLFTERFNVPRLTGMFVYQ